MAVQWPLETLRGDPVSVFNIAIDGRLRTDPPVHPQTLGCFLEYLGVSAPIRTMLGSATLADLALLIRSAVRRATDQFTDDLPALIESLEDVDRLVPTAFLDVPGFNCVQTSWINFQLGAPVWGIGWTRCEPLPSGSSMGCSWCCQRHGRGPGGERPGQAAAGPSVDEVCGRLMPGRDFWHGALTRGPDARHALHSARHVPRGPRSRLAESSDWRCRPCPQAGRSHRPSAMIGPQGRDV